MLSDINLIGVEYTGEDCGNCGGVKGCFSIFESGDLISKKCSVSEIVREIYRYRDSVVGRQIDSIELGRQIDSIELIIGATESTDLFYNRNVDGIEFNALNAGYYIPEALEEEHVPLPVDF